MTMQNNKAENKNLTHKSQDRFNKFEYPNDDFPYYNGLPINISGWQWLFVVGMVAVGFLFFMTPISFFDKGGFYMQFLKAVLFFVIPLVGLAIVAKKYWMAIFRKVKGKDVLWMFGFAFLNLVVTMLIGWFVKTIFGVASNAGTAGLATQTRSEQIEFFFKSIPSLFGEEVLTILPFLALMYMFSSKMKLSRKTSIILAWLISALIFGLAHLSTYDWNFVQCIVIIGSARLVLTLAYIKTKNIWVSFGAHIINDWILFLIPIIIATMAS